MEAPKLKLNIQFYHYRLPFCEPLTMTGVLQTHREGIIVTIGDDPENCGVGEIAPLPGLHRESLDEIRLHLSVLKNPHVAVEANRFQNWQQWADFIIGQVGLAATSVHFGIESAVLDWCAKRADRPIAAMLNENYRDTVAVNGLIHLTATDWEAQLEKLVAEGYRAIKIKVGRLAITTEAAQINRIAQRLPAHVLLRLDANRRWTLEEACRFAKLIDPERIEYIEEPLQDFRELAEFYRCCGLPLALDETLQLATQKEIAAIPGIKALILKASVLGGLRKAISWAAFAEKMGCYPVISSSVESGVGLAIQAHLAAALGEADIPAGLDTNRLFTADVLIPPFSTNRGTHHLVQKIQPDYQKLTRL